MAKKMLIDATHAEETRVVVVDGNKVEEFDFESENKRQLAGNIYLAKVTRVEPSLQAAFVDYGGNRHGFLAFSEIHPDYYQIPVADREALMAEERAYAEAMRAREDEEEKKPRRSRRRSKASKVSTTDAVETAEVEDEVSETISGMETIDLGDDADTLASDLVDTEVAVEDAVGDAPVLAEEAADAEAQAEMRTASAELADIEETVPAADAVADEIAEEAAADEAEAADEDEDDAEADRPDAAEKDESIEAVADDDDQDDIRPPRKPRPRRYKIQEVIKVRQILLVQVVKEERGNKGAALTTYLSLAGRYCVLMPNTARGGGISRKITNAADRKKLKEIATSIEVPDGAGLIVRTAGAKRTKTEIKRDYEYLQRLWEQIRELTLKSIAPAKIYEEGDLIKRSIRDLYSRDIDEVLVEGEAGYRIAKDFMKMIMPSHAKNVKQYTDPMPLFARFQVESYLASMFNPTVQLKSGGYIVIGVTEALVAIDVNSGRATKEGSIEETALKTNLEAAEEVARQLRLRDLAGLIVIDFIDMDERKNNNAVEKRLKDRLKTDRARIQVGRISGFGLLEMSRQRLRPGMIEATTQACPACHGTGLIRSDDNMALSILRQIEEEGTRRRNREVLVKAPVGIANFLMNQKREHIAQIEGNYGMSVRVEGDPALVSPDFTIEKFKTATRSVPEATAPVVSVDASMFDETEDEDVAEAVSEDEAEDEAPKPKKRRRRRRRRGKGGGDGEAQAEGDAPATEGGEDGAEAPAEEAAAEATADAPDAPEAEAEEAPKPKKRSRSRRKPKAKEAEAPAEDTPADEAPTEAEAEAEAPAEEAEAPAEEATEKPKRKRATRSRKKPAKDEVEETPAAEPEPQPEPEEAVAPEPEAPAEPEPAPEAEPEPEPAVAEDTTVVAEVAEAAPAEADTKKPRRRGWWSRG
ncbi:Rne/Rng family ribonuclease [Pseudaestuariivita atlantica]|uniref:Ribonuclease E n=1 Tax=Pseudaestuariivita atlantica TaxID=1317121 RepID=A0A0L1JVC8_9RHOB|nr:ribonuclease E/G [Pseudaestuariivita atlantica]KNG95705.1 ribonuclease [Pseudaestuariivita atlantica]